MSVLLGANSQKSGGGMTMNKKSGKMEQTNDHRVSSNMVTSLLNNQRNHIPIILIVGQYPKDSERTLYGM